MARCTRTATTDESTPPDRANRTRPWPTFSRISSTVVAVNPAIDHVRLTPQMTRQLWKTFCPAGVGTTCSWHWTAYAVRRSQAIAAAELFGHAESAQTTFAQ